MKLIKSEKFRREIELTKGGIECIKRECRNKVRDAFAVATPSEISSFEGTEHQR